MFGNALARYSFATSTNLLNAVDLAVRGRMNLLHIARTPCVTPDDA